MGAEQDRSSLSSMAVPGIPLVTIGELGTEKSKQVTDSISTGKMSYSSSGSSQFSFSVSDPALKFHNNGYFVIRRQVRFDNTKWEIAAVDVNAKGLQTSSVDITCRTEAIQKIKRDKGAKNFGAISPTRFASQIAGTFGLGFFGEASPAKEAIIRTQNETTDESSWDVLRRLAGDLEFEVFEAKGVLFFASRNNLIEKQTSFDLLWPLNKDAKFPVYDLELRRSDDDPLGATFTCKVDRTNGTQISPGFRANVIGVPFYENPFMVDRVDYDLGSNENVSVSGATIEDTPDTGCETQTFKKGSKGVCVTRIQYAMKVNRTGTFDTATDKAVRAFQAANGLSVTGVVEAKTWAKIRANT